MREQSSLARSVFRFVLLFFAVPSILFFSVTGYAHNGTDHAKQDQMGKLRSHDKTAATEMIKTKVSEPKPIGQTRKGQSRWGADFFPNVTLVTHEGKSVKFYDDLVKDKVVMINFMYANCEYSCSLATAQLSKIQNILGDRVGKDIFMYSISIDPENDTPAVLKKHMEKFNVKPGWTFLTGNAKDIMRLRNKLGFHFEGMDDDIKDHNGAVLIGNQRTGQWLKRSPMDNPYFLAEQVGTWLTNWKSPSQYGNNDYSEAPQMQVATMGENLFRTRCTACHTIGGESRSVGAGALIEKNNQLGPDLLDVTIRRDRAWLERWLANPAKMLAENDPIAKQLYVQYNKVIMPNFHFGEVEVNALIEYLGSESLRLKNAVTLAK